MTKLTKKHVKSATILFVLKWIEKKKVRNKILLRLPEISLLPPTLPQCFHGPPLTPPLGKDYSLVLCVCVWVCVHSHTHVFWLHHAACKILVP